MHDIIRKLDEKAGRRGTLAIAPKRRSLRALIAAEGVKRGPLDFGRQDHLGGLRGGKRARAERGYAECKGER